MGTAVRTDPLGNFAFLVELDGIARAAFSEVSGFDSTIDIIEHREGGDNTTVRKLPGITRYSNIVLKWGLSDAELYQWHRQIIAGQINRKNGSIIVLDRRGQEVVRWNFVNAWPSKWDGPDLNAEASGDVAVETLELAHEGIERAT